MQDQKLVGFIWYGYFFHGILLIIYRYLGFIGVILFPFDLANAESDSEASFMYDIWKSVYFITFALSWLILPIVQEYSASGSFTFKDRFIDSLKANLKFWIFMVATGLIVIIWRLIVEDFNFNNVVGWLITIGNTYGLTLIVLLLGFGLSEIPRSIYREYKPDNIIQLQEFRAADVHDDLFENKVRTTHLRERLEEYKESLVLASGYEEIRPYKNQYNIVNLIQY